MLHRLTSDEVNKVSEGLTLEDHKGRVLQRMQTLNWDTTSESSTVGFTSVQQSERQFVQAGWCTQVSCISPSVGCFLLTCSVLMCVCVSPACHHLTNLFHPVMTTPVFNSWVFALRVFLVLLRLQFFFPPPRVKNPRPVAPPAHLCFTFSPPDDSTCPPLSQRPSFLL